MALVHCSLGAPPCVKDQLELRNADACLLHTSKRPWVLCLVKPRGVKDCIMNLLRCEIHLASY